MNPTTSAVISSPIGPIKVLVRTDKLIGLTLDDATAVITPNSDPFIQQIEQALVDYFANPEVSFSIPLDLQGTPFQQKVWAALQAIPAGMTLTYGQLAERLESGPRAIGGACKRNPVAIIVPCHRVVATQGLGGYYGDKGGRMLELKKWLLEHEQNR